MGERHRLAEELEQCRNVERAEAGLTEGVVKAEIRNGDYGSLTPQILEQVADYPVTISPVGGSGINYFIIIE